MSKSYFISMLISSWLFYPFVVRENLQVFYDILAPRRALEKDKKMENIKIFRIKWAFKGFISRSYFGFHEFFEIQSRAISKLINWIISLAASTNPQKKSISQNTFKQRLSNFLNTKHWQKLIQKDFVVKIFYLVFSKKTLKYSNILNLI